MPMTRQIILHDDLTELANEAYQVRKEISRLKKEDKEITGKLWELLCDIGLDDFNCVVPGNELVISSRKTLDFKLLQENLLNMGVDPIQLSQAVEGSRISHRVLTIKGATEVITA